MMTVNFITYPDPTNAGVPNFSRGDIQNSLTNISPTAANAANGAAGNVFPGGNPNPAIDGRVLGADCADNDDDYVCTMEFDFSGMPATNGLELRVTNQYRATTVEFSMENTAGDTLLFEGAQAVIDVTGRAGDVYRRIEAALDLSTPDLLPDYTIQTATDICKDFAFTINQTDFQGVPGTSCITP